MTQLKLDGVIKRWPDGRLALDNVTTTFAAGTLTALIGPSGAGKTTLLRVIAGLECADEGRIENPFGQAGMVFQEPSLWPHLTLRENVVLPLQAVEHLSNMAAGQKSEEVLVSWGLADRLDAYPAELSGGEQQRGALARACVLQPKVLCLDEVVSALDPETAAEILKAIVRCKRQDSLILMATHQLGFVAESADSIVFVDRGRIVESGPASVILQNPQSERVRGFLAAASLR